MTDEILKFIRQYQEENAFYGIDSGSEFVIAKAFHVATVRLGQLKKHYKFVAGESAYKLSTIGHILDDSEKEIAAILGVKETALERRKRLGFSDLTPDQEAANLKSNSEDEIV